MAKFTRAKLEEYNKQISEEPKANQKAKAKKTPKKPIKTKEVESKIVAPAPEPKEEEKKAVPAAPPMPKEREGHIPRGERGDFLKTTITISAEMYTELRMLGLKRKAAKQKDTDTSALIREALTDFLNKHR